MAHQKYSRTLHLPFSLGRTDDDKALKNVSHFEGRGVVCTYKMDGENTSLYSDAFHARSLDSRHHPSRDWLAAFHATIARDIPDGWRVCGENLFAQHSLVYEDLPSYFMGFSVWDKTNTSLAWNESKEFMELLGITPVQELYVGVFDECLFKYLAKTLDTDMLTKKTRVNPKSSHFRADLGKVRQKENQGERETIWGQDYSP